MLSDKIPASRRTARPWYQSKTVYGITIVFMLLILLFGLVGISVTREIEQYQGYVWVPIILVVASAGVMISTIIRLIRSYYHK